jgi:dTDP-4-dehydrorhamnose 3,5-epimerase
MVFPGRIKAWHIHKKMTLNYAVPFGQIILVLYDDRDDSPTRGKLMEIPLGDSNYSLVTVPPMVWNGFVGKSNFPSLVANCSDIPHDPEEIGRISPHDLKIPYRWPTDFKQEG